MLNNTDLSQLLGKLLAQNKSDSCKYSVFVYKAWSKEILVVLLSDILDCALGSQTVESLKTHQNIIN